MEELIFVFCVMVFFILFLMLLKIVARILYYILFFPIIAWVNKILYHHIEKKELSFEDTESLSHYLLKYFLYTQYFISWILIIIYSCITGYLFSFITQSYVVIWVLSLIYFCYSFFVWRYKYSLKLDDDIQEIVIEWIWEIDLGDLIEVVSNIDI